MSAAAPLAMIKSIQLFHGLTEQEKDVLISGGRLQQYTRGETIFLHGEAVTHFYIICSGTIKLVRQTPSGREITTDLLIEKDTFCETEIFEPSPVHLANAVVIDDALIFEFPYLWLKNSAKKNSTIALNLLAAISRHMHMVKSEVEHRSTMSSSQLIMCFLQQTVILHDLDPRGFDLPFSKTLIASRLGMELETFSRALPKLKEYGIEVTGSRVVIKNLDRISRQTCEHCSSAGICSTHKTLETKMASKI